MFKEVVATPIDKSRRGLICGVGINDAWYKVSGLSAEGKKINCPYYSRWKDMVVRCYSERELARYPTYIGCSVSSEWLLFSNFRKWMETQDWKGKHLDKDILVEGNKIYSPTTCVFVTSAVNALFTDHGAARGECPLGVSWHKDTRKYIASCNNGEGKMKHLGLYESTDSAEAAYCAYKSVLVRKVASTTTGALQSALLRKSSTLESKGNKLEEAKEAERL